MIGGEEGSVYLSREERGEMLSPRFLQFGKLSRPRFSTVFVRKYEALENLERGIKRQW